MAAQIVSRPLLSWPAAIVLGLAINSWIFPHVARLTVDPADYIEVRSVKFEDTVEGVSPRLAVDRTVHQPFTGQYEVLIRKQVGSGFRTYCDPPRSGDIPYNPEAELPLDEFRNLEWWMGRDPGEPPLCPLVAGNYIVDTTWFVEWWFGIVIKTTVTSNTFTVRKR